MTIAGDQAVAGQEPGQARRQPVLPERGRRLRPGQAVLGRHVEPGQGGGLADVLVPAVL
jgi:hypothetical protein